jgi:hypothetical protein
MTIRKIKKMKTRVNSRAMKALRAAVKNRLVEISIGIEEWLRVSTDRLEMRSRGGTSKVSMKRRIRCKLINEYGW